MNYIAATFLFIAIFSYVAYTGLAFSRSLSECFDALVTYIAGNELCVEVLVLSNVGIESNRLLVNKSKH